VAISESNQGLAVVIGSSGGIGRALVDALRDASRFNHVLGFSRSSSPAIDLADETMIASAATYAAGLGPIRLLICATGFLHGDGFEPEKSLRQLDARHMAKAYAINAIGPALVLKYFAPLLPRQGRSVCALISAKVGSISDNHLGGWHSYRASKAALNQIVRTTALELERSKPDAIVFALHPGTVETRLSRPFSKTGLDVQSPAQAARAILDCAEKVQPEDSGKFLDRTYASLPW